MAAGFWHSQLSPLHGALLASTIANDGEMPYAAIVDRIAQVVACKQAWSGVRDPVGTG